ncbi:MAG: 4Fe-4S binding protein [Deltaproteobacteria bacterium]|nr:4Fe-4S binding protein [Deltaproteobacteria bacterium]
MLRWTRRLVQGSSLLLFFFLLLLTRYQGKDEIAYPVRLFLDLDPLILLATLLSSHALPVAFYAAIAVLALSFLFGRAFCGWCLLYRTSRREDESRFYGMNWPPS